MSMKVGCDHCGGSELQVVAENAIGSQWVTLNHISGGGGQERHFCSMNCVVAFAASAKDQPRGRR